MDTLNPDQSRPDTRNSAENESELVSNLADDGLASIVGGNNNEVDGSELGTNASAKAGKKNDSSALTKVLNVDMISKGISLLARTGNGLSMAYTKLDLHDKGLSAIDVLEQYPHLRYVNLASNSIQAIDALVALEYILSLDLSSNNIASIPASFEKRKYLQQANFAKNRLASFNVSAWHMLLWLNLNENRLKEIKLNEFPSLIHLEARTNGLTSTSGLKSAFHLQRLYLAQNQIEKISEIDSMIHLRLLHLRDNKIEKLDGFSEHMRELAYINLRGNKVANLSEIDKLAVLSGLKHIVLSENPICTFANYRLHVISRLKHLEKLDKESITAEEKEEAQQLKDHQHATVAKEAVGGGGGAAGGEDVAAVEKEQE